MHVTEAEERPGAKRLRRARIGARRHDRSTRNGIGNGNRSDRGSANIARTGTRRAGTYGGRKPGGNFAARTRGSAGSAPHLGGIRRRIRRQSGFVRGQPLEGGSHRRQSARRFASPHESDRRGSLDGEFARRQPGASRSARYELTGYGVAWREFDGRKSVRRGRRVGWAAGWNQFIRRDPTGNGRGVRQLESHSGCHAGGALVLFPDADGKRDLLPADRFHVGRAAGDERIGDSTAAPGQRASDGRLLSRRANSAVRGVLAISFCAAPAVGKHGGAAGHVSRRADAGEGWSLVFDGDGAQAFPVDA